jgi:hypothetical protein
VYEVANNGPSDTTVTPVLIALPVGFTLTDVNGGGACNPTADPSEAVCDLGPILAGDSVELVAAFDVSAGISVSSTPRVSAEVIDSMSPDTATPPVLIDTDASNNRASIDYSLLQLADLAISGTAPELFAAGPGITWLFTIDNFGPSISGAIDLQLTVPAGAVLTDATELYPGHGARPTWGGPVVCDASFRCAIAVSGLAEGESFDITFTFDMTGVAEGAVNLTGEVSAAVVDPDLSNNAITLTSGAVRAPVDPGTSGELPYTGSRATGLLVGGGVLLAGAGLLLLGTSTLAVRKRRRV